MLKFFVSVTFLLAISTPADCQVKDSTASSKDTEIDDKVFTKLETEASFPGGQNAWVQYLQANLKPDVPVKNGAPVGKYQVIIRFIVTNKGEINVIEAETKFGYGMEQEVIRIIRNSPNWLPGMQNGRVVNSYRRQPITFVVDKK